MPSNNGASKLRRVTSGDAEWIPLSKLHMGEGNPYQRVIKPEQVTKIATNFDPTLLGVPEVARRPDGEFWVEDGQNRLMGTAEWLSLQGETDGLILCHVKEQSEMTGEAYTAWKMNTERRNWRAYDAYNARLHAGEASALGVCAICDRLNVDIIPGGTGPNVTGIGVVYAVGSLLTLYERTGGPELLERTMTVLHDAWHGEANGYASTLVTGLASFLAFHGEFVDDARILVPQLQRHGVIGVMSDATTMKRQYKWSITSYTAMAIEGAYNFKNPKRPVKQVRAADYAQAIREYEREWARAHAVARALAPVALGG